MPLITIVMSHLNSLPYVGETLDSIAAQSYLDGTGEAEFIIFDDGSSRDQLDGLRRIVAEFQDHSPRRFANISGVHAVSPNIGKNRVLELAKPHIHEESRYVVVVDADDTYDPNFLKVLFTHLEEQRALNPNVVMAYCDNFLIDKDGRLCGVGNAHPFNRDVYFETDIYKGSNYIPGSALIVKKRFLKGIPKDFEPDRDKHKRHMAELGEDGIAVHVGFLQGETATNGVVDRYFFYRQHEDQMSGHMGQLETDPRYGPDGFFARWPPDLPKPHWKQFIAFPRETRIYYLERLPRADTKPWDHYRPRDAASSR